MDFMVFIDAHTTDIMVAIGFAAIFVVAVILDQYLTIQHLKRRSRG